MDKKVVDTVKYEEVMNDRVYRIEFNEKQQHFHLDNFSHEENTYEWFTLFEGTDKDFAIYEAYVNRIKKEKLDKIYLLACVKELDGFLKNLREYKLNFHYSNEIKRNGRRFV